MKKNGDKIELEIDFSTPTRCAVLQADLSYFISEIKRLALVLDKESTYDELGEISSFLCRKIDEENRKNIEEENRKIFNRNKEL